jgi:protein transport protein SEC31
MSSTYSIPRTATFAWSKGTGSAPLLATGTVSGALDESFSNSASLEIWDAFAGNDVDEATRIKGKVAVNAR